MKIIGSVIAFFVLVAFPFSGHTQLADTVWSKANTYYSVGEYNEAAKLYEQLLNNNGESAQVYFNLGNAYFKQDMLGAAHLNYERARRLDPQNPDILYNLDFVNALQTDKIDRVEDAFVTSWINDAINVFSGNTWSIIFFSLVIVSLLLLLVFFFSKISRIRKLSFAGFCVLFLLAGVSFYLGHRQKSKVLNRTEAIIFHPEVTVKSTPNNSGSTLFVIHEGLKVKIIEKQENYYRIILEDGKSQGWIPRESAEII